MRGYKHGQCIVQHCHKVRTSMHVSQTKICNSKLMWPVNEYMCAQESRLIEPDLKLHNPCVTWHGIYFFINRSTSTSCNHVKKMSPDHWIQNVALAWHYATIIRAQGCNPNPMSTIHRYMGSPSITNHFCSGNLPSLHLDWCSPYAARSNQLLHYSFLLIGYHAPYSYPSCFVLWTLPSSLQLPTNDITLL